MIISRRNGLKCLGLLLDASFNFVEHINVTRNKEYKGIKSVIKKIPSLLTTCILITIYKSFAQPRLNYGDVIYDQPNNSTRSDKIFPS